MCVTLGFPRVPALVSEAFVLRTYPFKEADLVVSFLTRDQGKLRGIARRARRPKNKFGSGLERLSHVRVAYYQRPTRELVYLDSCELIRSQFALFAHYEASIALDFIAELCEQLLPPGEANDRFFRLLTAVLEHLRSGEPGAVWRGATYFALWAVRLSGLLPDLEACMGCGAWLADPSAWERAFFTRGRPGLLCGSCRAALARSSSWELAAVSRGAAAEILTKPVGECCKTGWSRETCSDLRHFLVQQIETHIERKLVTVPTLEAV